MGTVNQTLALFGGVLLLLGLSSGLIKNRWYASEPSLALGCGILLGPQVLGWLAPGGWGFELHVLLEQAARITLAIALISTATRLPSRYIRENWRALLLVLAVLMPAMWAVSSALAAAMLGLSLWMALLVGAVVTPTDPVLASSVVSGFVAEQHVPKRIRDLLTAESGANDALAFPLVMLPVLILADEEPHPALYWVVHTLLWEVVIGAVIGFGAGWVAVRAQLWARSKRDADRASLLSVSLALAVTLLGAVRLAGSDGLLAAFVAGLALNRSLQEKAEAEHERLHEVVRRFFDLPVFILFGAALPWEAWAAIGWWGPAFTLAILLLRRLPIVWLLQKPLRQIRDRRDVLFFGWFGPVGIAALFYATLALRETGLSLPWQIGSLVIAASTILHGISATAAARRGYPVAESG